MDHVFMWGNVRLSFVFLPGYHCLVFDSYRHEYVGTHLFCMRSSLSLLLLVGTINLLTTLYRAH